MTVQKTHCQIVSSMQWHPVKTAGGARNQFQVYEGRLGRGAPQSERLIVELDAADSTRSDATRCRVRER